MALFECTKDNSAFSCSFRWRQNQKVELHIPVLCKHLLYFSTTYCRAFEWCLSLAIPKWPEISDLAKASPWELQCHSLWNPAVPQFGSNCNLAANRASREKSVKILKIKWQGKAVELYLNDIVEDGGLHEKCIAPSLDSGNAFFVILDKYWRPCAFHVLPHLKFKNEKN